METTVFAGEILYLPAGWFHEVRSGNARDTNHAALNYWFHPPAFGAPFDAPYGSTQRQNLWERDWAAWEEMRKRGRDRAE
jgi:fructosamine-3-kinase